MQICKSQHQEKWVIPSYNVLLWTGKKNKFCIIIPVVNEGERLTRLVSKIKELQIPNIADVIIADGGSIDGSINPNFLSSLDVAGILIKTGPGQLSAQLRCAYSFALKKGYRGIVTIDGNDKDDPVSIPQFIDALNSGFDFVQGSRFIPGGIAENTPLIRYIAIKLIHAPLISVASGFKWTDTTQGFRAYSRKMLLHEDIAVFRNVFMSYELLSYLSYRAPRLGLKCIEIPTMRRYSKGKIITKISFIRGNWSVLKILIKTCLGKYNP